MPSASSSNNMSTTPFITFIPAGVAPICVPQNTQPDRAQRNTSDPNFSAFQDAMTVREEVFVREQGVPLENELDEDDHRSFHWVVYASVASSCTPSPRQHHHHYPGSGGGGSSTTRIPVGTIRLIPPPSAPHTRPIPAPNHSAHQHPKQSHHHPDSPPPVTHEEAGVGAASLAAHGGNYIKLGRLATIPAFRGLGIGKLLIETALNWAAEHTDEIMGDIKSNKRLSVGSTSITEQMKKAASATASVSIHSASISSVSSPSLSSAAAGVSLFAAGLNKRGAGDSLSPDRERDISVAIASAARGGDLGVTAGAAALLTGSYASKGWDGKVLVHAQKHVKSMWEKFGFVYDHGMGEWDEEGIVHVGLWKQLQIKKPS